MLHPPAIRLSHLHPDLEKVIVLCRRFGYLNPVSRHQRSRANSVNILLDFSSLDNSGCVVIFGVPSTIEIDAVNLSVALFPFRSERSARPRHAIDARYRPAFRLDLRQPFVNGLSIPPRIHSRTGNRKRLFTGHGVYPRAKARWAMSVRWKAPSKAILSTPA